MYVIAWFAALPQGLGGMGALQSERNHLGESE